MVTVNQSAQRVELIENLRNKKDPNLECYFKFHADAIFRHTFYCFLNNRKHKNLNIIKKTLIRYPLLHVHNQ